MSLKKLIQIRESKIGLISSLFSSKTSTSTPSEDNPFNLSENSTVFKY